MKDSQENSFSLAAMVPLLNFLERETLSDSLNDIKDIYGIYIKQAQKFLDCHNEVILNFVTIILCIA